MHADSTQLASIWCVFARHHVRSLQPETKKAHHRHIIDNAVAAVNATVAAVILAACEVLTHTNSSLSAIRKSQTDARRARENSLLQPVT